MTEPRDAELLSPQADQEDQVTVGQDEAREHVDDLEDDATRAVDVAERWLSELANQMSVPASDVQDHLLDIWGALEEGPARSEVERWLTETLRRNLYSVTDINERLETLLPVG